MNQSNNECQAPNGTSCVFRNSVLWPPFAALALATLIVSPVADFPLHDDWIYAKIVRGLVTEHRYIPHSFAAPMAVTHIAWGALFTSVFGLSYTVLRLSTLVLAGVALWATARCGLERRLSHWLALLCAAVLLCNPIFFNLAYTYMTDVPFLAPLILAGLFYMRALRLGRAGDVALGSLFAVLAASIRQFGVFVSLAYASTAALLWLCRRRAVRPAEVGAFAAPWLAGLLLFLFLPDSGQRSPALADFSEFSVAAALFDTLWFLAAAATYLGLFMLPLTCARGIQLLARRARWTYRQWIAFPWVCIFIFAGLCKLRELKMLWMRPMPVLGTILYDLGTGWISQPEIHLMRQDQWTPVNIGPWWWLITFLAIGSAAVLFVDIVPRLLRPLFRRGAATQNDTSSDTDTAQELFLFFWGVAFLAAPYHILMRATFDRYFLPAVPPFAILCARSLGSVPKRRPIAAAWMVCALAFTFSLAGVQDYLAWNRAKWQAIAHLTNELKVPVGQIDGGFEYNGVYTSEAYQEATGTHAFHEWGNLGYWILDNAYVVAFKPREGYAEISRVPYFSWLGMKTRHLLVLKRDETPP